MFTVDATASKAASKVSPEYSVSGSLIRGSGGIGTTDCRDVVGSVVFVCQTRMSCGLLNRVSVSSRTKPLEEIPFFLRFRGLRVIPLVPCLDIVENGRVHVGLRQPNRWRLELEPREVR